MVSAEQSWWISCTASGLALAVLSVIIFPIFPAEGANIAPGYGSPIYAFEMARSVADLIAIFGPADDPARPARIAAMDAGNWWDYPFMTAYGVFLFSFFMATYRRGGQNLWLALACIGALAAFADAYENTILLGLSANIETAPNIELLRYPVWTKFLSIMLCGLGLGAYLFSRPALGWKIAGAIAALGSITVLPAAFSPLDFAQYMQAGLTPVWVIQLIYAGAQLFPGQARG